MLTRLVVDDRSVNNLLDDLLDEIRHHVEAERCSTNVLSSARQRGRLQWPQLERILADVWVKGRQSECTDSVIEDFVEVDDVRAGNQLKSQ